MSAKNVDFFSKDESRAADYLQFYLSTLLLLTLSPLLLNFKSAQQLFWYSDDLALLHELRLFGLSKWLLYPFGENFVPFFKTIWAAMLFTFDGWYLPQIILLWLLHATICGLFFILLCRLIESRKLCFLGALLLGLTARQVNLLMFSYHLTEALSLIFYLIALLILLRGWNQIEGKVHVFAAVFLMILACLSFSRGAVMSLALAASWFIVSILSKRKLRDSFLSSGLLALPAVGLFLILKSLASLGSSLDFTSGEQLSLQAQMFLHSYALNPLVSFRAIPMAQIGDILIVLLALILKCSLSLAALEIARRRNFTIFFVLLCLVLFDLGNAFLLGAGRYQEGLHAALVSRYQRSSLIAFLPCLILCVDYSGTRLKDFKSLRASLVLAFWPFIIFFWIYSIGLWSRQFYHHARWQGIQGRRVLLEGQTLRRNPSTRAWQGIPPVITDEDARAVTREFNLH